MVRLSEQNWRGKSLTAIAVAAHEVGRAVQHHQNDPRLAALHEADPDRDDLRPTQCWGADGGADYRIADAASRPNAVDRADWTVRITVPYATSSRDAAYRMGCRFWQGAPALTQGEYISSAQERVVRRVLGAAALTYFAAALADAFNLFRWASLLIRR